MESTPFLSLSVGWVEGSGEIFTLGPTSEAGSTPLTNTLMLSPPPRLGSPLNRAPPYVAPRSMPITIAPTSDIPSCNSPPISSTTTSLSSILLTSSYPTIAPYLICTPALLSPLSPAPHVLHGTSVSWLFSGVSFSINCPASNRHPSPSSIGLSGHV